MAVFVCSFGTDDFKYSLEVLRHSALTTGECNHVLCYNESHPLVRKVRLTLPPDLAAGKRGYMFWAWKAHVIHEVLSKVERGDVVLYCDAGTRFVGSVWPYLEAMEAAQKDVMLFRIGSYKTHNLRQKVWCKEDCFQIMDCLAPEFRDAYQVTAAVQIYRKSFRSMRFVEAYTTFCSKPEAMDDVYRSQNAAEFIDHRHDQSVLTNLSILYGQDVLLARDPTQFGMGDQDPAGDLNLPQLLDHHRQRLPTLTHRITVVTPTIGTPFLGRCIASVQAQTIPGVEHLVVVDGQEHLERVQAVVDAFRFKNPVHVMVLPRNTGKDGWNGHRIYAAVPFLVDTPFVAYLDEDNFYDADHLERLLQTLLRHNQDWTFGLRKIVDANTGALLAHDNCESLGSFCHTVMGPQDFLVDTSAFLFKTPLAQAVSPHWMHRARQGDVECDRAVTRFLMARSRPVGSPFHTLNYSVSPASANSVQAGFFERGNALFRYDFAARPTVYVFHFDPQRTAQFLGCMLADDRSYAMDEWQMTLLRGLAHKYNMVNGYAMQAFIPAGACVYVTLCHTQTLPFDTLLRKDVVKILYTIESPNVRHRHQWDKAFLFKNFDHLLTYWEPLLQDPAKATFCRHNTHHLDLDSPRDRKLLHTPTKPAGRDVVVVLERRDLRGTYRINDVELQCLDFLRERYVQNLADVTVYGQGWDKYHNHPCIKIGHAKHRSQDPLTTVDILKDFTFVLIAENVDAEGYVSEKIYDAFIAGCIPLYYGNNNDRVGIPADMFVDLRRYPTSQALQAYLDQLSLDAIEGMRNTILEKREAVLAQVSIQAFAQSFDEAHAKLFTDFLKTFCLHLKAI
jgi:glycosyltransferase involved in cell wall biosynthesis